MKNVIRKFLSRRGYYIFKEGFIPKGYRFQSDLANIIKIDRFNLIMDIGAFQGIMTKTFLEAFPLASIITVEPTKDSYEILKSEFSTNKRVVLENCGVGKEESTIEFKVFENGELNSFKSNINNDEAEALETVKIPVHTLDYILKNSMPEHKSIDFLKIDVEGFEMEVLQGANSLLNDNEIGCIFIEAGFCEDDERHTQFKIINEFLINKGFSFFALYDLYHYRKSTELLFANALFLNEKYLFRKDLLIKSK
ncbi:MAG: FkbM family methyltransferase [Chitinophagaceae bacterium]